jgi:hypothetical protein
MNARIKKWMFPAVCAAVISAAVGVSAQVDTAYVPFVVVNTDATVKVVKGSVLMLKRTVTKNVETTLAIPLSATSGVGSGTGVIGGTQRQLSAPAAVSIGKGKVALRLSPQSYKNAEVSLHTVNGKRVLHGKASAAEKALSVTRGDLTAGVYLLSVKGSDGNAFASRVTHRGGSLDISAAFSTESNSPSRTLAKESAASDWAVTVSATGYIDSAYNFEPVKGRSNAKHTVTLKTPTSTAKADFKETVAGVSFDMVYVPGGEFTIGCEAESSSDCPSDTKPVSGVKVSNYFIGKTEVTIGLYKAVMGVTPSDCYGSSSGSCTCIDWYDAVEFTCKLSQLTGRRYRMTTEAEWEFAAKKHKDKLEKIGTGEEWAYNSWSSTHSGGTDPVGPMSGGHTQKTRRDAQGTKDAITGRLIRSIEGKGPALRLALSADVDYPPNMVPMCDLHIPKMYDSEYENSYRDKRWITGDDYEWGGGFADFIIKVWDDGAAVMGMVLNMNGKPQLWTSNGLGVSGEWYTVNNFAFRIAGTAAKDTVRPKLAYIFVDIDHVSLIAEGGNAIGRFERRPATFAITKPTIPGTALSVLTKAPEDKMIDMANIPASAKGQDERLLDGGPTKGWFQNNTAAGGVHHYRKDVDKDEFRFTVNQGGSRVMLTNGTWFTVNNTFLRVTHKDGYTTDYLYAVTGKDDKRQFYHNSFQGYERGDFRVFTIETNGDAWPKTTCGDICKEEIPKGLAASMYANQANGKSTYQPAPCPTGGCK